MNARVGAIFPGQGSQVVGMGADVARNSPAARALFDRAQEILGYDLRELMSNGPEERLRETQYSQPAIFTCNVALYTAVGDALAPVVSAGHSFGELCSLTVADSLSFDTALRIVDERGKAMQHAAELAPGGMSAVLGMEAAKIAEVVAQVNARTRRRAQLANFNSPTQIVISGDLAAVQAAGEALLEAGAKRVVPLNVSGAWHSALMLPAVARYREVVDAAQFGLPRFDVVSNLDAKAYRDVAVIKHNVVASVTNEVRWHETAMKMLSYNLDLVVEFGATPVLGPLFRRLPDAPQVLNVTDFSGAARLRGTLEEGGPVHA